MFKYLITLAGLLVAGLVLVSFVETDKPVAKTARENYTQYCASCHGEKVEAFVDRKWKNGNEKSQLVASISNGYADLGMPAWKGVLNDKEIQEMADLVLDCIKNVDKYKFETKPTSNVFKSEGMTVTLDTVASSLDSPWGMAFLPNNEMLVSDRIGVLYHVDKNKKMTKVTGTPEVLAEGQGGLLDVALHPQFAKNNLIYLSYSAFKTEGSDKLSTTAVMRAKFKNNELTEQKTIFEALPYAKTRHHYGSRLVFDKKGFLYFSVGDRGDQDQNPQFLNSDCGKIHRIKDDGSIPADNPFVNTKDARPTVFSFGHRNPQGVVYNPKTDEIWEHEHGPRGGDEVNIIKKANNYGWPVISYGINYDGSVFTKETAKEGMQQPQIYWLPSIAPCGMTFIKGDKYKTWQGDLLVGSLRFNYVNRCVMKDNKIVKQENVLKNVGRVRNITQGEDGYVYVATENPGYVFRLLPTNQ
ncbi:MAG: PQQ-dependent sugar dehydrogenase [Verrucomicrobia bacterium]|nr:PQQ-dependent sugar dehydrogenase [Cytophagales bacterium]